MLPTSLSSGDLVADRRADYARHFAGRGDFEAAVDLMRQALDLAPGWAAGWMSLGEHAEKAGLSDTAADAYRQVLALAETDIFGAGMRLAVLGRATVPPAPPAGYVEALFDDYAERFDAALVERLGYRVPDLIADAILAHAGPAARFAHTVDLGCGTGLAGARLRALSSFLEGTDLSTGMLAKAAEKGFYDRLSDGDFRRLAPTAPVADLVTAADVFAYLGDLDGAVAAASRLARDGALLAFSVEEGPPETDWRLQPSLRYQHGEAYLAGVLDRYGFRILSVKRETLRTDAGEPVAGLIVLARKNAPKGPEPIAAPAAEAEAGRPLPQ